MDAGNPFLAAINSIPTGNDPYASPNFLPSVLQNAQSQAHGVDLSGFNRSMPMPSALTQDLVNSGSWGRSTSAPVLPAALSGSQQQSGPGFWGNVWNGITGGYNHLQGMLQGQVAPGGHSQPMFMNALEAFSPFGMLDTPGMVMRNIGGIKGLFNPAQAKQNFQTGEQNTDNSLQQFENRIPQMPDSIRQSLLLNPSSAPIALQWSMMRHSLPTLFNTAAETETSPLTYVPFEKPVAIGLKGAKVLSGIGLKGLGKAYDATIANKVEKAPPSQQLFASVANLFKPMGGTTDAFRQAETKRYNTIASGTNDMVQKFTNIFKVTTPEQRSALINAMEPTKFGTPLSDPELEALRQQVDPIRADVEKRLFDSGRVKDKLDLQQMGVGQHIPHIRTDKFDLNGEPLSDGGYLRTTVDAAKQRGIPGTISDINANPNLPNFETDAFKVFLQHALQANKAVANKEFIDTALAHGLEPGGAHGLEVGDLHPETNTPLVEYTHEGKTALLPKVEAEFLDGLSRSKDSGMTKIYKGTVNKLNQLMFLSKPWMHPLNNLGWQALVHDPGIFGEMGQHMPEAFGDIKPGSTMDEALKNGALHLSSEISPKVPIAKVVNNAVGKLDGDGGSIIRNAFKKYNGFTPGMERAYRTAAFSRRVNSGMSPEQAAEWVRSIFGGHATPDMVSPAEKAASMAMPFFNWTKTAVTSNAKNFLRNPAPYVATYQLLNNLNKDTTGHDMWQNQNPLTIGLPWSNKQGLQSYYEPYFPAFDMAKIAKEVGGQGALRGGLNFAFNRMNPAAKLLSQILSDTQNPFAQSTDKYPVVPYEGNPLVPPQAHGRGILFGDKGWKVNPWAAQTIQDIPNPITALLGLFQQSLPEDLLTSGLSGNVSNPNPASKTKQQNWQNNQWMSQWKSYQKKQGN